jgi:hypothetical protein
MTTERRLEDLRLSLIGVPSWEIRAGGLVWYVCGRTMELAIERWNEVAYKPPGFVAGRLRVRMAYL